MRRRCSGVDWWSCTDGTSTAGELHDLASSLGSLLLMFAFGLGALAASTGVVTDGRPRAVRWFAPLVVAIGVVVTLATRAAWTSASCDARSTLVRRGAPAHFEVRDADRREVAWLAAFADCVLWTGLASVIVAVPIAGRSLLSRR